MATAIGVAVLRALQVAADDEVDRQQSEALGEVAGVLGAQRGERVRVVLVAGLKGVGRIRLTLAVANDDELLIVDHAAARCTAARINS